MTDKLTDTANDPAHENADIAFIMAAADFAQSDKFAPGLDCYRDLAEAAVRVAALASSSVPEQDKPFNARLETDGILTPEGSYPDRIWFTPEDNSSAAYIRLDLHEAASSSVPEAPQQTYAEMIDRVMLAVCDPGCIVGYKGERSLNEWQRDALQVILPPPPEAPQDRGASQEDGRP